MNFWFSQIYVVTFVPLCTLATSERGTTSIISWTTLYNQVSLKIENTYLSCSPIPIPPYRGSSLRLQGSKFVASWRLVMVAMDTSPPPTPSHPPNPAVDQPCRSERERERGRERGREGGRGKEGREGGREGERERERENFTLWKEDTTLMRSWRHSSKVPKASWISLLLKPQLPREVCLI